MSVTYKQATKANINRAIAKAQQIKPRVQVNGFNDFTVTGSKGDAYSVKFSGKGEDFTAHCTCKGSERELVCYHTASAAPIYKMQIIARAAERTCPGCGANSDLEEVCICAQPVENCKICDRPAEFDGYCTGHSLFEPEACIVCNSTIAVMSDGECEDCHAQAVREAEMDLFGHN
jgi:hypothetical protein